MGPNEKTQLLHLESGLSENSRRREAKKKSRKRVLLLVAGSSLVAALLVFFFKRPWSYHTGVIESTDPISIAFLGNSMFYFNDFPRFFEALSDGNVEQNSCLHGGASIPSLVADGNGMFPKFTTEEALITGARSHYPIYDYGACTPRELILGQDRTIDNNTVPVVDDFNITMNLNPCVQDVHYRNYIETYFRAKEPLWDFILINDNTRNPARLETRQKSLETLGTTYVPWFRETGATPVFLWTHAYSVESTPTRNMSGLDDVANFTSLTYVGLRQYVNLLEGLLSKLQTPKIAPVGLAFLTIYEENFAMWKRLFHSDHIHASPHGTFLQGCVVHYTLFGRMPPYHVAVRRDMASLWSRARMMQHANEPPNPIPTRDEAAYLYRVAQRVVQEGHVPKCFIHYQHGEGAEDVDEVN